MLTELIVENLGVIDRAEVAFDAGSTALTGETGAGKTLLVTALGLLAGGRADRTLVRAGATAARVEGMFVVDGDHPVLQHIEDVNAGPDGSVEIVLGRTVAADGKTKARVDGRIATVNTLSAVGGELIEIAGQNEHHRLGSASEQRALLDQFAGPEIVALAIGVADKVSAWRAARSRLEQLTSTERERVREVDILQYEISEIQAVAPTAGETEELTVHAQRLEHAEALASGLSAAIHTLKGESGAGDALATARSTLEPLAARDTGLEPLIARLRESEIDVADVASELAGRVIAPDARALEEARSRLDALARLHRKFGPNDTAVLAHLAKAEGRLAELTAADADIAGLTFEVERLETDARASAAALSVARQRAAPELARAVERLLGELAMPGAAFEIVFEERELYEGGQDSATFAVSANPGEPPKPLAKVASGGELSRISLALRLLTARSAGATMVFDEVDAGVGGQAAQAVGARLAQLASESAGQVFVVTHLPQVAAFADRQFRILKVADEGHTGAAIEEVEAGDRVAEITRMLAGLPDSERGRAHAEELLEIAGRSIG
ncbi:MAG: DNA repair protein RecN [Actinomycetota bacterium]|nr:DNA repair protein RecN [Actinomycetota bacterium]